MNRRKVTLKLYPGACAAERLTEWVRLHCELYNAALQERIELSAGLGLAHQMLLYKAEEAGSRLHLANTRQLKPSQRCARCWEIVPKTLAQRVHQCSYCGHTMPRDQNSALVVLIDAHTPGTGVAARQKPLGAKAAKPRSKTRETPTTARQA